MTTQHICAARQPEPRNARERGVRAVIALTATMMVVEIVVGYATHSMALTADGWHMATHVAAFGMAALGYAISRRFATHEAFAFGTGKVPWPRSARVHRHAGVAHAAGSGGVSRAHPREVFDLPPDGRGGGRLTLRARQRGDQRSGSGLSGKIWSSAARASRR